MAETGKGNLTLSNACTAALCSGGPYDLIAFWLIAWITSAILAQRLLIASARLMSVVPRLIPCSMS